MDDAWAPKDPTVRPSKVAESLDLATIVSLGGHVELKRLLMVFMPIDGLAENSDFEKIFLIPGTQLHIMNIYPNENKVNGFIIGSDGRDGSEFISSIIDIEWSI